MLPLIDTHQHLWDLSRLELPWTGGIPQLNRSFLMSDYLQASEGQKVSKTVYMEVDVHPDHRQREVEIISEICSDASNPMQATVFCAEPGGVDFEPF
ncbi:MAG: amidohydrolase, partial [SAR324 cluster bacterium]|nr:amidohydrolase [SAR324 cluster bacterium]